MDDARFKSFFSDPRSRRIPKNVSKIKIDKRFKGMFKKKQFKDTGGTDERGRKLDLSTTENLKKLYNVDESSEENVSDIDCSEVDVKLVEKTKNTFANKNNSSQQVDEKKNKKDLHGEKRTKSLEKKGQKNGNLSKLNVVVTDGDSESEDEESEEISDGDCDKKLLVKPKSKFQNKKGLSFKEDKKKKIKDLPSEKSTKLLKQKGEENVNISKINIKVSDYNSDSKDKESEETSDENTVKKLMENVKSGFNNKKDTSYKVDKKNNKKDLLTEKTTVLLKQKKPENDSDSDSEDEDSEETSDENSATDKDVSEKEESSSDSDSDSESSDEDDDVDFDHNWEELQKEAPDAEEITKRLAVCNMDWDRIRAADLYSVFNSFKPSDGVVLSVKIFPSEFGLKCMADENVKGPAELVEKTLAPDETEPEDEKSSNFNREKLRQYQLKRLKYYYAVVECDTPETANTLHEQLNGMEYESSSTRFDLRFIPDDVTFDQEPSSVADKVPDPKEYKPRLFITTALQQVQVDLTWDETDPARVETMQKAFKEPESIEKDIKLYLASSSGESDDNEEEVDVNGMKASTKERISKFKALLQSIEAKEKENDEKVDMEVTWEPGLKEKTASIVKQKIDAPDNPFEEMMRKKKQDRKLKNKNKKDESNAQADDLFSATDEDSDSSTGHLSKSELKTQEDELYLLTDAKKKINEPKEKFSKKKKKKENVEKSDFTCDVSDPRFSAVYTSHEYNIDPSNPHFRETEATKAIIQERQKRLQESGADGDCLKSNPKRTKYY